MFIQKIFFALIAVIPFIGEAKIYHTTTIEDILPLVDKDTWVVIDLDNTTFEGKQALGHTDWFYDKAHALMREGMTLDEATRACYPLWIEVQKVCPVKPVETAFIPALIDLQKQGTVVMGLTHRQPSIADSTIRQINSLGLNLLKSAPNQSNLIVPSETPTKYTKGVLFTGEYNKKGEIFVKFLSIINQTPKKVLFIDDKLGHVEDVGNALNSVGIEYTGIHYTACEHLEKIYDPEIAAFQLKIFSSILSNEAALLLMEKGLE